MRLHSIKYDTQYTNNSDKMLMAVAQTSQYQFIYGPHSYSINPFRLTWQSDQNTNPRVTEKNKSTHQRKMNSVYKQRVSSKAASSLNLYCHRKKGQTEMHTNTHKTQREKTVTQLSIHDGCPSATGGSLSLKRQTSPPRRSCHLAAWHETYVLVWSFTNAM